MFKNKKINIMHEIINKMDIRQKILFEHIFDMNSIRIDLEFIDIDSKLSNEFWIRFFIKNKKYILYFKNKLYQNIRQEWSNFLANYKILENKNEISDNDLKSFLDEKKINVILNTEKELKKINEI